MRNLVNAVLAFTFVLIASGTVPASALHMGRINAMRAEFAAVENPALVKLRPSFFH